MSIIYEPEKLLEKIATDKRIKRMIDRNLDLNKTALAFTKAFDFISSTEVAKVAIKTIKDYEKRVKDPNNPATKKDIKKNPKQLIQRVQNSLVFQISKSIKKNYRGKKYEWLPSNADDPDPTHQLRYGKIYTVGKGEMPGERYGCKCGMRILTDEEELNLS